MEIFLDFASTDANVVNCGKDDCCGMLKEYFIRYVFTLIFRLLNTQCLLLREGIKKSFLGGRFKINYQILDN